MLPDSIPIPASRLRGRTLQHGDSRIRGVSLFPFFDNHGRVLRVMATTRDSFEVYLLPSGQKLPSLPPYGRMRLPAGGPLLVPIRREDLDEIKSLWHFDPWWVLDEARFGGHWARSALKETNCVKQSGRTLLAAYYQRDLSEVKWVVHKETRQGSPLSRLEELGLPEKAAGRASRRLVTRREETSPWILDPIWTRK